MERRAIQELVKKIVGNNPYILIDDGEESRKALKIIKNFESKYGLNGYIKVFKRSMSEPSDYYPVLYASGPFIPCEGVERIEWYFDVYIPHEIEKILKG